MDGRKERHRYYTIMVQRSNREARGPGVVRWSMGEGWYQHMRIERGTAVG